MIENYGGISDEEDNNDNDLWFLFCIFNIQTRSSKPILRLNYITSSLDNALSSLYFTSSKSIH